MIPKAIVRGKADCVQPGRARVWLFIVIGYLQIFGYTQLAKPYCAGEPHILPIGSALALGYPCDGSLLDKVLYLAVRPSHVYQDYLFLQPQAIWISASAATMLLRVLLGLVAPGTMRAGWAFAVHRMVAPLTLMVWILLYNEEPSPLALWFVRSYPLLDCVYVVFFPTGILPEAIYGATSFAASTIIGVRILARRSGTPFSLPGQLLICAASTAMIVYYHHHLRSHQKQLRGTTARTVDSYKQDPSACLQGASVAADAAAAVAEVTDGCGHSSQPPSDQLQAHGIGTAVAVRTATATLTQAAEPDSPQGLSGQEADTETNSEHRFGKVAPGEEDAITAAATGLPDGEPSALLLEVRKAAAELLGAEQIAQCPSDAAFWTAAEAPAGLPASGTCADAAGKADAPPTRGSFLLPGDAAETLPGDAAGPRKGAMGASATRAHAGEPSDFTSASPPGTPAIRVPDSPASSSYNDWAPSCSDFAAAGAAGTVSAGPQPLSPQQPHFPPAVSALVNRQPTYTPVVRMMRLQLKIHGAEPDQVASGFEERISRVIGASGYELESVYLRRGCIELVVDARAWQRNAHALGPAGSTSAQPSAEDAAAAAAPPDLPAHPCQEVISLDSTAQYRTAGEGELSGGAAASTGLPTPTHAETAPPAAAAAINAASVIGAPGPRIPALPGSVTTGTAVRQSGVVVAKLVVMDVRTAAAAAAAAAASTSAARAPSSVAMDFELESAHLLSSDCRAGSEAEAATGGGRVDPASAADEPMPWPAPQQQEGAQHVQSSPLGDSWDTGACMGSADIDIGAIILALGLPEPGDVDGDDCALMSDGGCDGGGLLNGVDAHGRSSTAAAAACASGPAGAAAAQPASPSVLLLPQSRTTSERLLSIGMPGMVQRPLNQPHEVGVVATSPPTPQTAVAYPVGGTASRSADAIGAAAVASAAAASAGAAGVQGGRGGAAAPPGNLMPRIIGVYPRVIHIPRVEEGAPGVPLGPPGLQAAAGNWSGGSSQLAAARQRLVPGPFTIDVLVWWPEDPDAASATPTSGLGGGRGGNGSISSSIGPGSFASDSARSARSVLLTSSGSDATSSYAVDASGPASPRSALLSQQARAADTVELLLRSRGRDLAAKVVAAMPADAQCPPASAFRVAVDGADVGGSGSLAGPRHGPGTAMRYRLEVPYLPAQPGLLLLEASGVAIVPVLLLRDAPAAAELQAAIDCWSGIPEELDDLLLDISAYAQEVPEAEARVEAEAGERAPSGSEAEADGGQGGSARAAQMRTLRHGQGARQPAPAELAGSRGTVLTLSPRVVSLGCHLLAFAVRSGWSAVASLLQSQLSIAALGPSSATRCQAPQPQPPLPQAPLLPPPLHLQHRTQGQDPLPVPGPVDEEACADVGAVDGAGVSTPTAMSLSLPLPLLMPFAGAASEGPAGAACPHDPETASDFDLVAAGMPVSEADKGATAASAGEAAVSGTVGSRHSPGVPLPCPSPVPPSALAGGPGGVAKPLVLLQVSGGSDPAPNPQQQQEQRFGHAALSSRGPRDVAMAAAKALDGLHRGPPEGGPKEGPLRSILSTQAGGCGGGKCERCSGCEETSGAWWRWSGQARGPGGGGLAAEAGGQEAPATAATASTTVAVAGAVSSYAQIRHRRTGTRQGPGWREAADGPDASGASCFCSSGACRSVGGTERPGSAKLLLLPEDDGPQAAALAKASAWLGQGDPDEDFRSYKASWRAAHVLIMQWVDVALFLVAVCKLRSVWAAGAAAPGHTAFTAAVAVVGTSGGLASAAAWMLLPRLAWTRLAGQFACLRQACNFLVKLLVGWSGVPVLPCYIEYELGLGVWLLEGVVLPGSCMMSPARSLLLALAKVPLLMRSWMVLGGGAELSGGCRTRSAVLHACGVACLSVSTTLAFHWGLSVAYKRRQRQLVRPETGQL